MVSGLNPKDDHIRSEWPSTGGILRPDILLPGRFDSLLSLTFWNVASHSNSLWKGQISADLAKMFSGDQRSHAADLLLSWPSTWSAYTKPNYCFSAAEQGDTKIFWQSKCETPQNYMTINNFTILLVICKELGHFEEGDAHFSFYTPTFLCILASFWCEGWR